MQSQVTWSRPLPIKKPLKGVHKLAYGLLIGWWFGGLWLVLGYLLCLTVLLLPLGVFMLWNATFLLLLQYPAISLQFRQNIRISPDNVHVVLGMPKPPPILLRAIWFILVGWWLGGVCCVAAYLLCLLIFPRQAGVWVIERIPSVMVLQRMTVQLEF